MDPKGHHGSMRPGNRICIADRIARHGAAETSNAFDRRGAIW